MVTDMQSYLASATVHRVEVMFSPFQHRIAVSYTNTYLSLFPSYLGPKQRKRGKELSV